MPSCIFKTQCITCLAFSRAACVTYIQQRLALRAMNGIGGPCRTQAQQHWETPPTVSEVGSGESSLRSHTKWKCGFNVVFYFKILCPKSTMTVKYLDVIKIAGICVSLKCRFGCVWAGTGERSERQDERLDGMRCKCLLIDLFILQIFLRHLPFFCRR